MSSIDSWICFAPRLFSSICYTQLYTLVNFVKWLLYIKSGQSIDGIRIFSFDHHIFIHLKIWWPFSVCVGDAGGCWVEGLSRRSVTDPWQEESSEEKGEKVWKKCIQSGGTLRSLGFDCYLLNWTRMIGNCIREEEAGSWVNSLGNNGQLYSLDNHALFVLSLLSFYCI